MRLYIANCTHQRQTVFWRADVNGAGVYDERRAKAGLRSVNIAPGQQTALPEMEIKEQIQSVMDQLAKVGGVGVEEIPNRMGRYRIAYVLSTDKPVPKAKIVAANDHNKGIAINAGRKQRQAAAIAVNHAIDHTVREAAQTTVRNMTVEIEQEARPLAEEDDTPGKKRLAEGFEIVKEGEDPKARQRARGARARAEG